MGQTQKYVFTYTAGGKTYYLGTSLNRPTAFNPESCIWDASGTIGNGSNRNILTGGQYLNGSTTSEAALTLGATKGNFRSDGHLGYYSSRYYYVYYNNGWKCSRNSSAYGSTRVVPQQVAVEEHEGSQSSPIVSPVIPGDNAFHALGTKSYTHTEAQQVKAYTKYTFDGSSHYWYDGQDHNSAPSEGSGDFTYRWVLSVNMNDYASVDNEGHVTYFSEVPEYYRVGSLSCEATDNVTGITLPVNYYSITFYSPNFLTVPVINSLSHASGNIEVWFTYPETIVPGLTFYYTTDGTQPTTGSLQIAPGVHFTVPNGTMVNVMAAAPGYHVSEVVSERMEIGSGVYETTVILNDYEDHNWSYYSDADSPVKSLYPRNVAITYYGNGTKNMTTDDNAPGANNMANATGVAVSRYESQNTFVYYKTLERYVPINNLVEGEPGDRFPYQLIANPFSKRPVYGTNNTTKWRGFYGWRIKSITGGQVFDAPTGGTRYNVGDIITDEYKNVYFYPNNHGMTNADNETSMTIEFEAIWARAYRVQTSIANVNANLASTTFQNGVSYERNFLVINDGTTSTTNLNQTNQRPVTVMMVEPDGSADYRASSRYINPAYVIPHNNMKFEWINMQVSNTLSANGKNLVVGRGVLAAGASGSYASLGNMASTSSNPNPTRTANRVNGLGATASDANSDYSTSVDFYLRLESGVYENIYYVSGNGGSRGRMTGTATCHVTGFFGNDFDRANKDNNRMVAREAVLEGTSNGFGNTASALRETMKLYVKSGTMGTNYNTAIYNSTYAPSPTNAFYTAVGSSAQACGLRRVQIEGGSISCLTGGMEVWNGTHTDEAYNKDKLITDIRIRNNALIRSAAFGGPANAAHYGLRRMVLTGGQVNGWVAGACNGNSDNGGQLYGVTQVYVGGDAKVGNAEHEITVNGSQGGNVFGAGRGRASSVTTGEVAYGTNVVVADKADILHNVYGGGDLGYALKMANVHILGGTVNGTVFGGANQKKGENVNIVMRGGLVKGGIYGGSNLTGTISGNVNMQLMGGIVGLASEAADVYGGGLGPDTRINGNVDITLGVLKGNGPTLFGSVYGGSAKGIVNTNTSNHTHIVVNNATMAGYVYGGGMGDAENAADVNGNVQIDFKGGVTRYVFGGNFHNGAPKGTIVINMTGGTVYEMFGGGDEASYTAPSAGYPQINITGGKIMRYFYSGQYAGGNVYGGGHIADVIGSPVVNIMGTATQVDYNVYGGGCEGNVSGSTTVNIKDATIGHSVYGAGYGEVTLVGGNTSVTVDGQSKVQGNVYGGGEAGDVAGSTTVIIGDETTSLTYVNDVFGAGQGAESDVRGENGTHVIIKKSATVKGSVYGGAEEGTVRGEVSESASVYGHNVSNVTIENGRVRGDVFGGGKLGIMNGRAIVNMEGGTVEGNIFGGALGTQGQVYVRGLKTVNMTDGLVVGDVYGGSKNADDANEYFKHDLDDNEIPASDNHSSIFVNISGGRIGKNVYGGGFFGTISGNVTVNFGVGAINNGPDHAKNINKRTSLATTDCKLLAIEGDVYAGSDWGEISGSGQFGKANISGYSNIYIDGEGYDMQPVLQNNYMNIAGSIFGAGTSSDAGMKGRRIWIREYGLDLSEQDMEYETHDWIYTSCSRKLFTIQRADSVYLENAHIAFKGHGDMTSAFTTQHYAMLNVFKELRLINNSTIDVQYPVDSIFSLSSTSIPVGKTVFDANPAFTSAGGDYSIVNYDDLADYVYGDPGHPEYPRVDNKLNLHNGTYLSVRYPRAWNKDLTENHFVSGDEMHARILYGEFRGYFHMVYPDNYALVYARPKVTTRELPTLNGGDYTGYWQEQNINDGGLSSYRKARHFDEYGGNVTMPGNPHYEAYMAGTYQPVQGDYLNQLPQNGEKGATPRAAATGDREFYRFWNVDGAHGDSEMELVLVAKTDGSETPYLTAKGILELSPINRGGFVKIRSIQGVDFGDDAGLVNTAVISQGGADNWAYYNEHTSELSAPVSIDNPGVQYELDRINAWPNNMFGLSIAPRYRLTEVQELTDEDTWTATTDMLISPGTVADDYYLANHRFYLGGYEGESTLEFCLTYSNKHDRNTQLSPITIIFDSYNADGTWYNTDQVHVTIFMQTTINQDFDEPLYALMSGKGEKNSKTVAKATLPLFNMEPGHSESNFYVKSIGDFIPATGQESANLVTVAEFKALDDPEQNTIAMEFGPSLTYDNTNGWLEGYNYSDPEASLYDVKEMKDGSVLPKHLGTADGRKNLGLQFRLYYDGTEMIDSEKQEIGHFDVELGFDNVLGIDEEHSSITITVTVYKRGRGTDWYIDGQNGLNSNNGHYPNAAKHSLNGVLSSNYIPGDNIFIVDEIVINANAPATWSDEKGSIDGLTLYRYPGGHAQDDLSPLLADNGCYNGTMVTAKSELRMYGIILNGLDSIADNGRNNYFINNVEYVKPAGFAMHPTSPMVVVEEGGTLSIYRSEFIYNANEGNENEGGAIRIENGGTLNINDQSRVSNNRTLTAEGAGIYVSETAKVNVMDNVYVADNTRGGKRNNIYLSAVESVVNIDKEVGVTANSVLGITKDAFQAGEDHTPIAYSSAQHVSEEAYAHGVFFDDQIVYAVYYDRKDPNLSENNVYFIKTWVTAVTEEPENWDITAIDTPEDLAWLISYVNGYNGSDPHPTAEATVTADIDMNAYIWVPIGNEENTFKGVFDGNGYEITGLRCSLTGLSGMGLFGVVNGGTVKNTFVLGGTLTSKDKAYMGSIAGIVKNGGQVFASEGALNLNTVTESTIMGGLVGLLDQSTLHSSLSVANLNGYQMGGLVGENTIGSQIHNCYAFSGFSDAKVEDESGNIIPNTHYIGGVVADNDITIENCYVRRRANDDTSGDRYAYDGHDKGHGHVFKCYCLDKDVVTYTDGSASSEIFGSCAMYEEAIHPYTYGDNYNKTVRNGRTSLGLVVVLNLNADTISSKYGYEPVRWTRTTSDINNDYPVLMMPTAVAVSTNLSDSILYYHHTLNDALARYNDDYYDGDAIVAVYANSDATVSEEQTSNVKLYINENVAVLQNEGVDLDAYVGITLDNSAGVNGANPTNGEPDAIDWHMFSTSLQDAPLGLNYTDNNMNDWWTSGHAAHYAFYPDDNAFAGYFPGNTPVREDADKFDFYCYYEPEYHWINFKRNGNSHWHQDTNDEVHDWINYGYTGNDYSGSGETNKYTFGKDSNNESELIRGKGYLLAVEEETYLQANGTLNNGPVTYYNVTRTSGSHYPGLNLIGNPYQSYLDFKAFAEANAGSGKIWSAPDKAFYCILDEEKRGYVNYHYDASWNQYAADRFVHMHQGFFIVTQQDSTTAVFNNDMRNGKGANTTFRNEEQPRYPLVNLILNEENGNKDYAVVELNRPKAGGASKVKSLKSGKAQIYVHYNDEDYSIAFTEVGVTSVPVRFKTEERNVYTLNWDTENGTFSYLHLIDNMTGIDVDCLENDEYVFGADPNDYESRFRLVFQFTGVEENENEVNGNFAFISGSDLIVNGTGHLECVDLQGRILYVTDLYGTQNHVALPKLSQGMYLLRLSNGRQCSVQKLVIK